MKQGADRLAPAPGSRTIGRALGVLDSFTVTRPQWRTTSLAAECGLPIPTTHRILRMLERFGYLIRDRSGEYRLGPKAARLARGGTDGGDLRALAVPALRAVHRATGERASLFALAESRDHGREVCAVGADEPGREPASPRVGPLHAGAPCKVLLAQLGNEDLARAIDRGLDPIGPATITRPAALAREIAAIRRRGWAFSREETAANEWAVAVPIAGPAAASPGAVAVSAPLSRCEAERARHHVSVLAAAARWISRRDPHESGPPLATSKEAA